MAEPEIEDETVQNLYDRLKREAEDAGYHLNPDEEFTKGLVRGILENEQRYGYWSCPCRLGTGDKTEDLDVICPCDYRDPDLNEYGSCYCALYVSAEIANGRKNPEPIPERRPPIEERAQWRSNVPEVKGAESVAELAYPVWRCRVCGYLCARDDPPETCPICKAKKERFMRFI